MIEIFEELTKSTFVRLTDSELDLLKSIIRKGKSEKRIVDRARIVLWSNQGLGHSEIARKLNIQPSSVVYWRLRFIKNRNDSLPKALEDFPRSGRPKIKKFKLAKQAL